MIVTLHTRGLKALAQIRAFVDGNSPIAFTFTDRADAQQWMIEKQFVDTFLACSPPVVFVFDNEDRISRLDFIFVVTL